MRLIVRGYGDGKLVLEDREEFTTAEELRAIVGRHLEDVTSYGLHKIEIECLEPLELPTHCKDCGVVLMGGATKHKPDCAFQAIINRHFGGPA